jgi:F-box/leucine-rich repeat protein 14
MKGKLEWFQSVTTVDLRGCEKNEDISSTLVELRSLPSLRTLELPASCTERAVDAEAVYGLTTVTTLKFEEIRYMDHEGDVEGTGEWVLDLSRLTTVTSLFLGYCPTVTGEQVEAASSLTGLTELSLRRCSNVSTEGLCTVSRLTALTNLDLGYNFNVTTEVLRAVSGLNALTSLDLWYCDNVMDEGLLELRSLTALTTLYLSYCPNVTDAGKQALRTALPNLAIY